MKIRRILTCGWSLLCTVLVTTTWTVLPSQTAAQEMSPLADKAIALNAGHGLYQEGASWVWQRGDFWGIREDLVNAEIQVYTGEALKRLGATVIYLREPDVTAGNGTSGYPRWQEAARHYLEYLDAPSSVWDNPVRTTALGKDLVARPYSANHFGADLLISIHNNGGEGTGTETWYDTTNDFHDSQQALQLAQSLQSSVVGVIRSGYDSSWMDRGTKPSAGGYAENHYANMPAALIEIAFIDRQSPDNDALHDETFKALVGEAIAQGVCDYYGVACPTSSDPNSAWLTDEMFDSEINTPVETIRSFLQSQGSCLANPISDVDGQTIDIPTLVHDAAVAYQLNPKIILATMQKEQSAITRCPNTTALSWLMGAGTASTARDQIDFGASLFRAYRYELDQNGYTRSGWGVGVAKQTQDGVMVTPATKAIAGQFTYTPYAGTNWGGNNTSIGGVWLFWNAWYNLFHFDQPLGDVESVTVPPTLVPAYSGTTCGCGWYEISDNFYLTLNTNNSAYSTNSATWRPNLPQSGRWKVEAYIANHPVITWPCEPVVGRTISWDTSDARYTVYHRSGSTPVVGNQRPLTDQWLNLGEFDFDAGTGGYVSLTDLNGETNFTYSISFNVVRFTLIGTPPPTPTLNAISNADGDGNYPVTWGAASGATSYTLQEDDNSSFSSPTEVYSGSGTSWNASGKTADTYYYRVQACNTAGCSSWSGTQAVTVADPSGTQVAVAPSAATGYVGSSLTIGVTIAEVSDLGSFEFTLSYDPALVSVAEVTLGSFPESTGRTFTAMPTTIDTTAGTVTFGAYSIGSTPAGASGSGSLAEVRFDLVAVGQTALTLGDVQVSTVPGASVPVSLQGGTLEINNCLGDFDGDGHVDITDVQKVAYRWNTSTGDPLYVATYDLDGDGDIDILDVQKVAFRWGTQCAAGVQGTCSPSSVTQTADLWVDPGERTVRAGDTFTVGVAVSEVVNLGAFEFTLGYDPSLLEVVTATLGSLPESTGRPFTTMPVVVSSTLGTVTFGAYSLGSTPDGASGTGTLAALTLRALAAGSDTLTFDAVQLSNVAGDPQTVAGTTSGNVIVKPVYYVYLPLVVSGQSGSTSNYVAHRSSR